MLAIGYWLECEQMEMIPAQEPVMTTRAELVAILEELREVLIKIDTQMVDRRYVDFAALAERLHRSHHHRHRHRS